MGRDMCKYPQLGRKPRKMRCDRAPGNASSRKGTSWLADWIQTKCKIQTKVLRKRYKLTDEASGVSVSGVSASVLTLSPDPVVMAINASLVVFVSTHQEPVVASAQAPKDV